MFCSAVTSAVLYADLVMIGVIITSAATGAGCIRAICSRILAVISAVTVTPATASAAEPGNCADYPERSEIRGADAAASAARIATSAA